MWAGPGLTPLECKGWQIIFASYPWQKPARLICVSIGDTVGNPRLNTLVSDQWAKGMHGGSRVTRSTHDARPIMSQDDGSLRLHVTTGRTYQPSAGPTPLLPPRQYQDAQVLGGRSEVRTTCGHCKATGHPLFHGLYDCHCTWMLLGYQTFR